MVPFALAGTGMALVFAPVANVVLSSVRPEEQGKASGANNAIREVGGALGVAVLAAVFSSAGSYRTGHTFVNGLVPAVWTGAGVLAVGALLALLVPRAAGRKRRDGYAASTRSPRGASSSSGGMLSRRSTPSTISYDPMLERGGEYTCKESAGSVP